MLCSRISYDIHHCLWLSTFPYRQVHGTSTFQTEYIRNGQMKRAGPEPRAFAMIKLVLTKFQSLANAQFCIGFYTVKTAEVGDRCAVAACDLAQGVALAHAVSR